MTDPLLRSSHDSDVRIVRGHEALAAPALLTPPEKTRDLIVSNALGSARQAEQHIRESVEWLTIIRPASRHDVLITKAHQLVMEIEELE